MGGWKEPVRGGKLTRYGGERSSWSHDWHGSCRISGEGHN